MFSNIFPENKRQHSMQIVSLGKNLHDMSKYVFWEKIRKIPGPSCSKLTTSLVNDSLKLTSSDTQIC